MNDIPHIFVSYNPRAVASSAYHRMDLMQLRNRLRYFANDLRSVVRAHSTKHSNYVVLPKALVYSLLDDLDTIIKETSGKTRTGFTADERIASNVADRISCFAEDAEFPVTESEARILRKVIDKRSRDADLP